MATQKKILVVEDDELLRNMIVDQLSLNYTILTARDGQEALDQLEPGRPDAIVLDLLLPKVDGFTVLSKLRELPDKELAHTSVIVVTNLNDPESIKRVREHHVEEYFIKADINFGILLNRIKRLFNSGPTVIW